MCIFARPVERVAGTCILVAPYSKGEERYQLTCYANEVAASAPNAMILPVPLPCVEAAAQIMLVNLESVADMFEQLASAMPAAEPRGLDSDGAFHAPLLEVQRCGSFKVSIASRLQDLERIDRSQLPLQDAVGEMLQQEYGVGFGFVVCMFQKGETMHPMGYLSPLCGDSLFVPTKHEHGETLAESPAGPPLPFGVFPPVAAPASPPLPFGVTLPAPLLGSHSESGSELESDTGRHFAQKVGPFPPFGFSPEHGDWDHHIYSFGCCRGADMPGPSPEEIMKTDPCIHHKHLDLHYPGKYEKQTATGRPHVEMYDQQGRLQTLSTRSMRSRGVWHPGEPIEGLEFFRRLPALLEAAGAVGLQLQSTLLRRRDIRGDHDNRDLRFSLGSDDDAGASQCCGLM